VHADIDGIDVDQPLVAGAVKRHDIATDEAFLVTFREKFD
jgi:hypothetical protein